MPPKSAPAGKSSGKKAPAAAEPEQQQQQQQGVAGGGAAAFTLPKASPIANYKDDELTERQRFLLSKMANMKLYKPPVLPPPRQSGKHGWFHRLYEKYNIETALYMIEPWERIILNTLLCFFFALSAYWVWWLWTAVKELSLNGETFIAGFANIVSQVRGHHKSSE